MATRIQTRPTQLLPHERRLWERFVSHPPFPLEDARFSVRLGQGIPVNPAWPKAIQRMARILTQKRADVIVTSGEDVWILEIKRRAGFSALGQLLGYGLLYVAEYDPVRSPRLGVIAESVMSDMLGVLSNYGIEVFLVGDRLPGRTVL